MEHNGRGKGTHTGWWAGGGLWSDSISRLFDQAALLVVQLYNSIGSQRRLNILSPLIDNNTKVLGDIERRVIKIGWRRKWELILEK